MVRHTRDLLALLTVSGLFAASAFGQEYVTIQTARDATIRIALSAPEKVTASVLLLPGGGGDLKFDFFPTSQISALTKKGFAVAAMDVASDRKAINNQGRISKPHLAELQKVVALMKEKWGLPVWVVGTSASCLSAANLASGGSPDLAGVVFAACLTNAEAPDGRNTQDLPLGKVTVPALILFHENDRCNVTPPSGAKLIAAGLTASPRVETKSLKGGSERTKDPCRGNSYHLFNGIEDEGYNSIAAFITAGR